ncbi:MAG: acyl-CoA synthetase [Deltaproteobacteria bacterium]|nr:acyl-CoA synthetase [Deltaproteobacteria bacterium]
MSQFNFANTCEAVADAFPERDFIHFRDRVVTYGEFRSRSRKLANYLRSRGLGKVRERKELQLWESGQDHVGLYLYNGNEYLEGMVGSYMARCAPFNVNYRYVADELEYLLNDSRAKALVYHARFAPVLSQVLPKLPDLKVLLQVPDDSGNKLLSGAVDYEEALALAPDTKPDCTPSPDDLYILYTGGTTGMPKGVMWRQEDIFFAAMGGTLPTGQRIESIAQMVQLAKGLGPMLRALPAPPFMHGASHWVAFTTLHGGGTVVIQDSPERYDPDEILTLIEREKVTVTLIIGDAFAVPLVEQMDRKAYNLKSLKIIGSGGAILSPKWKAELKARFPGTMIRDAVGSSESGAQGIVVESKNPEDGNRFQLDPLSGIASEDLSRILTPADRETGWMVRRGLIPLGYLNDEAKTKKTFVTINNVRWSVPGDHAAYEPDGTVRLFGRGSQSINSGGEKIYPEEVEKALKSHPAVYDAVVVGTPHPKWVEQVTAVIQPRGDGRPSVDELNTHCASQLAKYKLPKAVVYVNEMVRSPAGKADYRWAKKTALEKLET